MKILMICGLAACLELIASCAGTLDEDEYYERADGYFLLAEDYDARVRRCRETHGLMVSEAPFGGKTSRKMTADQMRLARCVERL